MASVCIALIILLPMFKFIGCALMCKDDQLMRNDISGNYICCYTVICQKGQKYAFCNHDQGYDTCTNCPEGMYHLDTINTAIMNAILDPCIPKPTCDQPEVTLKNGECVCDRSRGYYGNDVNNCLLAEGMCSSPGFELKDNGRCEPCDEEYFKPEANSENLCKRKSRCFESQEIDSNGSTTEDRSCRAKTGNTKNNQIVTTDNRIDSDKQKIPTESQEINIYVSVFVPTVIIGLSLACVVFISVWYMRKKSKSSMCQCTCTYFTTLKKKFVHARSRSTHYSETDMYEDISCSVREKSTNMEDTDLMVLYTTHDKEVEPSNHKDLDIPTHSSSIINTDQDLDRGDNSSNDPKMVSVECYTIHNNRQETSKLRHVKDASEDESSGYYQSVEKPEVLDGSCSDMENKYNKTQLVDHSIICSTNSKQKTNIKRKSDHLQSHNSRLQNADGAENVHDHESKMNKTISSDNCRYSDIEENQDQSQGVDAITILIPEEDGAIMDNYSKDGHRVKTTSLDMSRKEIKGDERRKEKLYRSDERLNSYNENRINKTTIVVNNENKKNRSDCSINDEHKSEIKRSSEHVLREDKDTQTSLNGGLLIIEDEHISDLVERGHTGSLQYDHYTVSRSRECMNEIDDKQPARNANLKGEHRTTKRENTVNANWKTLDKKLSITHPENHDSCRKVVTNNAPRPSDSEISNEEAISADDRPEEDDDISEVGNEPEIIYLPAVDSMDYSRNPQS